MDSRRGNPPERRFSYGKNIYARHISPFYQRNVWGRRPQICMRYMWWLSFWPPCSSRNCSRWWSGPRRWSCCAHTQADTVCNPATCLCVSDLHGWHIDCSVHDFCFKNILLNSRFFIHNINLQIWEKIPNFENHKGRLTKFSK